MSLCNFKTPKLVDIQNIYNETGSIGVVEASKHLGFSIKRLYFLHNIKKGSSRGAHAHTDLYQCIVSVSGSFKIDLEGKGEKFLFILDDPSKALLVPPGYWRNLSDFSKNAVCVVLASHDYYESSYIRDYQDFLEYENSTKVIKSVPYIDFSRCYLDMKFELDAAYERVMDSKQYICGDELFKFEKDFAKLCGAEHCIGVANGLEAISLTMEAWGINKPHMEVICATNSFVATALGISRAGAKPILVEPDEKTFNISPEAIKKAITPNTKAIALTHLYGQPANMDEINSIAKEYSLKVFEDSAQAHLAEYKGRRCGSLGDAAGFSFYPTKNLGAFGDSGAIVTNNSELANKLRVLRNYGSSEKYVHKLLGTNSRMDELQASFLNIKLKKLTEWTAHKRSLAETYIKELKGLSDIVLPFVSEHANPVWHVFTIRILNNKRSELIEYLEKHNIGFNIHYPVPIHLQECYKYLNYKKGDFPIAEKLATEILSLPIDSYNSIEEIKYVANIIRSAMKDIKDNNSNDFSLIDSESKEIVS